MKKRNLRQSPMAEINVVPYIDVMLVLLVIFMITAPMLTQGVNVQLPKAQSDEIKLTGHEPLIVSVNKEGEYYLNVNTNPEAPIDPKSLLIRVAAELQLAQQSGEQLHVLVKGDEGVSYGKVVVVMSLLKQAGAQQVGLLTEDSTKSEEASA